MRNLGLAFFWAALRRAARWCGRWLCGREPLFRLATAFRVFAVAAFILLVVAPLACFILGIPGAAEVTGWHVFVVGIASAIISVIVPILGLGLANQFFVASRYLGRAGAIRCERARPTSLVSSRREFVRAFARSLRSDPPADLFAKYLVPGEWGSGKSLVVDAVDYRLRTAGRGRRPETPRRPRTHKLAVVHTDVWTEASEPDIHFAMFEALLSNPRVLRVHWFGLRYSPKIGVMVIVRRVLHGLRGRRLQVRDLSMSFELPPLLWQSQLEEVVARMRVRDTRIVWFIDEIDRAPPETIQAVLSLIRRSLTLRGVTVVMPYVRTQFAFKAFHPANVSRPDIASTVHAALYAEALDQPTTVAGVRNTIGGASRGPDGWFPQAVLPQYVSDSVPEADASLLKSEPAGTSRRDLMWRLALYFERLPAFRRKRAERTFSEKYLDGIMKEMPPFKADEVPEFIWRDIAVRLICGVSRREDLFSPSPNTPGAQSPAEVMVAECKKAAPSTNPRAFRSCLSVLVSPVLRQVRASREVWAVDLVCAVVQAYVQSLDHTIIENDA